MSRCLIAALLVLAVEASPAPAVAAPKVAPKTCGDVKALYRLNKCCGHPTQAMAVAPACPYDFTKPACSVAEPQAPRVLTTGAVGIMKPKAATLNIAQQKDLPLANVHYHIGAEHKSDGYKDDTDSKVYDAANPVGGRRLNANPRPGWMCPAATAAETSTAYVFKNCQGAKVGKSYEVHYVHSSAAYDAAYLASHSSIDLMNDGLTGAAHGRGQLNPMIVVQAQVYQLTTDAGCTAKSDLLLNGGNGWTVAAPPGLNRVMYAGSTTGQSHTNAICSPYAVTWHVDTSCHKVCAASFDKMCGDMKTKYKLDKDLYPHGSRILVDKKWVVQAQYVKPLA